MVNGQRLMVNGHRPLERTLRQDGSYPALCLSPTPSPLTPHTSRFTLHDLRSSGGFTILEMLIVLFLLTLVVVVVLLPDQSRRGLECYRKETGRVSFELFKGWRPRPRNP